MGEYSWSGNLLKIKTEPLRSVEIDLQNENDKKHPLSLRKEIEPWLTALFQSEHLSLLVGSGLTAAIHNLATENLSDKEKNSPRGMYKIDFTVFKQQLEESAEETAKKAKRGKANIEDQIRVVNDFIKGMEIYLKRNGDETDLKKDLDKLKEDFKQGLLNFTNDILQIERNIAKSDNIEKAMFYLTNFLISFSSRSATRERLNLFTTNYDRLIEFGADLAGMHLIDRFIGSLNPVFRASRLKVDMHYNPPGIRGEPRYLEGVVYYNKLHGSLDWFSQDYIVRRFPLPFGIDEPIKKFFPVYSEDNEITNLMIYPNENKDKETTEYPYVELFRDLATAICRPNATLVVYGYSFGDDHINRIIKDMLTIPSTHLIIISFSDEEGRVKRFYESSGRSSQITVLFGKHFADLRNLVDYYLPKPALDQTTYRMANLLKARGISPDEEDSNNNNDDINQNGENWDGDK